MAEHSPATRAIVAAFNDRYELCGPCDDDWQELCLAAAFRAAADLDIPDELFTMEFGEGWGEAMGLLKAIAAELEGSA